MHSDGALLTSNGAVDDGARLTKNWPEDSLGSIWYSGLT